MNIKIEETKHRVKVTLEKRHGDINKCVSSEERIQFLKNNMPYEIKVSEGNLFLNEGMDEIWRLATGQGAPTAYSNANARIGVGNSNAIAIRTQTGLQGGSTAFASMEAGYPTAPGENAGGTGRAVSFKASFGAAEANFDWEEWTVDNGAVANKNMDRKVESNGTKAGDTWTLTVEISLS